MFYDLKRLQREFPRWAENYSANVVNAPVVMVDEAQRQCHRDAVAKRAKKQTCGEETERMRVCHRETVDSGKKSRETNT